MKSWIKAKLLFFKDRIKSSAKKSLAIVYLLPFGVLTTFFFSQTAFSSRGSRIDYLSQTNVSVIAPQRGSTSKTQMRQAGVSALFDALGWAGSGRQLIETPKGLLRPPVARSTTRVASEHSSIVELIEKEIQPYLTSDTTGGFCKNSSVPTRAFLGFVINEIEGQARRLQLIVNETNLFCYQNEQSLIFVPKMGSLYQNLLQVKKTISSLNTLVQATNPQNFAHLKICNESAHAAHRNLFEIYKDIVSLQYEIGIAHFQQIDTPNCKLAKLKRKSLEPGRQLSKMDFEFSNSAQQQSNSEENKAFLHLFMDHFEGLCANFFQNEFFAGSTYKFTPFFFDTQQQKNQSLEERESFLKEKLSKTIFSVFSAYPQKFSEFLNQVEVFLEKPSTEQTLIEFKTKEKTVVMTGNLPEKQLVLETTLATGVNPRTLQASSVRSQAERIPKPRLVNQASQALLALATQSEQQSLTAVPEAVEGREPEMPLVILPPPAPPHIQGTGLTPYSARKKRPQEQMAALQPSLAEKRLRTSNLVGASTIPNVRPEPALPRHALPPAQIQTGALATYSAGEKRLQEHMADFQPSLAIKRIRSSNLVDPSTIPNVRPEQQSVPLFEVPASHRALVNLPTRYPLQQPILGFHQQFTGPAMLVGPEVQYLQVGQPTSLATLQQHVGPQGWSPYGTVPLPGGLWPYTYLPPGSYGP